MTVWNDISGLSDVSARLFTADAQVLDKRLDALAATVCGNDPRTAEQRRADALGALAANAERLMCRMRKPGLPRRCGGSLTRGDSRRGRSVDPRRPERPAGLSDERRRIDLRRTAARTSRPRPNCDRCVIPLTLRPNLATNPHVHWLISSVPVISPAVHPGAIALPSTAISTTPFPMTAAAPPTHQISSASVVFII